MAVLPRPQRDLFQLPEPPQELIPRAAIAEITVLLWELMLGVIEGAAAEKADE
jgi:hypothetical protein